MSWAGLIRVLTGFSLAIAVLVGGGYFAAQYLISQFTALPPKPTFPNDKPAAKPKPAAKEETSPQSSLSPSPAAAVPKTGYPARVKLSEGLNLRDKPSREGVRVGGLNYNDRVTILEETADKEWQKIRLEAGDLEGWIKSGYTERVN